MDASQIGFFTAQPYMVDCDGFPLFGWIHLAYLAYSLALMAVLIHLYTGFEEGTEWGRPRRTMMLVVAGIPLVLLISQDAIMSQAGVFGAQWWPLHSCNICEYVGLIYALRPNRFMGEVLFTLGIFGALCALLFPNWSYCPPFTWPVVCGFTEHSLIIAFMVMQLAAGDFKPRLRDVWQPAVLLGIYAPIAYVFNKQNDTNYLFINTPSPGSPLVGLEDMFGSPGYVFAMAAVLFAVFLGMHALWRKIDSQGIVERYQHRRAHEHATRNR